MQSRYVVTSRLKLRIRLSLARRPGTSGLTQAGLGTSGDAAAGGGAGCAWAVERRPSERIARATGLSMENLVASRKAWIVPAAQMALISCVVASSFSRAAWQ